MGAPVGHPFFGNQYTNGGYIPGTFCYIVENAEKIVDYSSKLVSHDIGKAATKVVTRQKPENLVSKVFRTRRYNKNALIVAAIGVGAVVGYYAYKNISKKSKVNKLNLRSIELSNVGTCTKCGKPLIGSEYVPGTKRNNRNGYIICKDCGESNFAWYPDQKDSQTRI